MSGEGLDRGDRTRPGRNVGGEREKSEVRPGKVGQARVREEVRRGKVR